jgi:hypothetical protein
MTTKAEKLTPELRRLRASIAANVAHATHDSREMTKNARKASAAALDARLLAVLDPDGDLPADERERRLKHARKAHFAGLAFQSAKTRQANAAAKRGL